ncbi:hypothetical protein SK128_016151 [Halocaridina rubra]|uniref:Uncharacterized protein n=1 Tax=Halocaridina rubra TaxID=373956 RepID=A0AAN9ADI1_HALRR
MSTTDSSDDRALAEAGPLLTTSQLDFDHTLQRSIATYRYENAMVKTEFASALERHAREINELKLKHQAQIREVEQQNRNTVLRLREAQQKYADENRRLQQSSLQLHQKIKAGEEDLEVIGRERNAAIKEKSDADDHWQQRLLSSQTSLQSLKEENKCLKESTEKLRGELDKEKTTVRELTTTLNSERHQQHLIKSRLSEIEQQCKIQLTAAQAEVQQLRRNKDIESADASKRINDLLSTLEEEKSVLMQTKERANAREIELEKKLAEQKQTVLASSQQLIQQNSTLQEQIKALIFELFREIECFNMFWMCWYRFPVSYYGGYEQLVVKPNCDLHITLTIIISPP